MLKSLYAGVSGMRSNQTKMDVIGNNIANVNTTAFKGGRARFQDMLSQTMANAQSPTTDGSGGINSQQAGLGVRVGSIDTIMTNGALQPTGRDLDFAIENDGFFAISEDSTGTMKRYTRDGAFYSDFEGNLVNASGYRILGYIPSGSYVNPPASNLNEPLASDTSSDKLAKLKPLTVPSKINIGTVASPNYVELSSFSIDGSGLMQGVYSDGNTYLLGRLGIVKFNNPEGMSKLGDNTYTNTGNSGFPEAGIANTSGFGTIRQGVIEMSNVDLANEFTEMIITSRAYQANSRSITTSDEMLQELLNLKR